MGPPTEVEVKIGWRTRLAGFRPQRRVVIGWICFAVAFAAFYRLWGFPFTEDMLLLWVTAAVFVWCLGDLRRFRTGFLRDWLPLYIVLGFYALLRGYADHLLFNTHITPQLDFDKWIAAGIAPTVRLQRAFFRPDRLRIWDYAAVIVYISHFFASFVVAGVLWIRDHRAFKRFMALYVTLMLTGFATYVLYPAMPPWLASKDGYMPASMRVVPVVWNHLGVHFAAALFEHGSRFNNDVAAVPSLHAACPLLICLFFYPRVTRTWLKVLLVAYVPAMALALVYTAEHFVFDIILGWMYALVIFVVGSWVLDRLQDRRLARADRRAATAPSAPVPVGAEGWDIPPAAVPEVPAVFDEPAVVD